MQEAPIAHGDPSRHGEFIFPSYSTTQLAEADPADHCSHESPTRPDGRERVHGADNAGTR